MITGKLVGKEAVLLRLRSNNIRVRDALRGAVTRLAIMLLRYVKERKLSGQVLKNRTGTLRRKVNQQVKELPDSITASVGLKLSYAAIHEYGFDGVVSVREHTRVTSKGVTNVRAHAMHMRMPERSYLRSSLRENAATIRETMAAAVYEALAA